MKRIPLLLLPLLFSCQTSKKEPAGEKKIAGIYLSTDGKVYVDLLLKVVVDKIKYNSDSTKKEVTTEIVWGRPGTIPAKDSTGKILTDSTGKQIMNQTWFIIGKDSVYTQIENKNIDSLLQQPFPSPKK